MASLGVLTAGVAHEINNPLNFINGAYLGLESFFDTKLPEYKDDVFVLMKGLRIGIERASEIIKGLNHFSRDSKSNNVNCNLHSIIDNCLLVLTTRYRSRIRIEKNYEECDLILKGNDGQLHQLFTNIISNAIQSIDNNGVISIKTKKNTNNISVYITDTGCGIKEENISKILDPFFTTKEQGEGTGLGLSIAYNIIKDHNGTIEFESEVNKGTTVKITFSID
jgi:signal transduction histidine kinase